MTTPTIKNNLSSNKEAGLQDKVIFLLFLSATRLSPLALRGWWGSFELCVS